MCLLQLCSKSLQQQQQQEECRWKSVFGAMYTRPGERAGGREAHNVFINIVDKPARVQPKMGTTSAVWWFEKLGKI